MVNIDICRKFTTTINKIYNIINYLKYDELKIKRYCFSND